MALLEVSDLSVRFDGDDGAVHAVDQVSFTLQPREVLAIVGESGCGKSVTAMSLLKLLPPAATVTGEARFDGRDLLSMDARAIRSVRKREISFVFQEPMTSLNPAYTVGRQVGEVLRRHMGLKGAAERDRTLELLELVGIPAPQRRISEYPHQLSGGMRQRVVIAMALVMNPALVIADEPTTALDVTIQAQILELLGDLTRRLGTSVLLITHDLGVVAENCTRVIVMYAGEVVEEAATSELFAHAHHPYTEGLLGAMPRVGGEKDRLATIPGTVPPPTNWPKGCRFRDRCPYSWERCEAEHPPLYQIGGGHTSRCHLAEEPERRQHPHPPLAAQRGATAA